jgi:hypothetical protein
VIAGKQVVSYRAGLLLIMAYTVREMSEEQINSALMRNTAKLAMAELSANKVHSILSPDIVFPLFASVLTWLHSHLHTDCIKKHDWVPLTLDAGRY